MDNERYKKEVINMAKDRVLAGNSLYGKAFHSIKRLRAILDSGISVNSCDMEKSSLLHRACSFGDREAIKLLIERSALVNLKDNYFSTPLHYAQLLGDIEIINLLISHGADINALSDDGETPLHMAGRNGFTDAVELLIEKGGRADIKNKHGWTAAHLAFIWKHNETADILMKHMGIESPEDLQPELKNPLLLSPKLIIPSKNEKELPSSRKKSYIRERSLTKHDRLKMGRTYLHNAVINKNPEEVKRIMEEGQHVNIKDSGGNTPLHFAEDYETAEILIKNGADVNIKNNYGEIPLHMASEKKYYEIVKLLIEKGSDINSRDNNGKTPLHKGAFSGLKEIGKLLIKAGGDVNSRDENGMTPIFFASTKDMAELLLDKGATIDIKDEKHGSTPLHRVWAMGHNEAAEVLIERGAHMYTKNNKGQIPLNTSLYNYLKDEETSLTRDDYIRNTISEKLKYIQMEREDDPFFANIYRRAENEAEMKVKYYGARGSCHAFWSEMEKILHNKKFLPWFSPNTINPLIMYD